MTPQVNIYNNEHYLKYFFLLTACHALTNLNSIY